MKIAGFANGNYVCKCKDCRASFVGDKRAFRCEECAKSKEPFLLFLDKIHGQCDLATHPATQHLYDKYELLVRIGVEAREMLREMQELDPT
jgi:hypothetical protein